MVFLVVFLGSPVSVQGQEEIDRISPLYPTPDYVQELLNVAIQELGYEEGRNNYSKYGQWFGDPNAQWCAEFLGWCVDQVDQRHSRQLLNKIYPLYGASNVGRDWFIQKGRYIDKKGNIEGWGYQWIWGQEERLYKNNYIPQPGDWMFFTWSQGPDTDHVAMVEYCALNEKGQIIIHVIEGNNPSAVARNTYPLTDSNILGFGTPIEVAGTTMRFGNQGDSVTKLQQKLCDLGYLEPRHISGTYKSSTREAVRAFQEENPALKANGLANMQTQIALEEAWMKWDLKDLSQFLVEDE